MMAREYLALRDEGRAELIVKKSRFIATARPVDSEDAARDFIDSIRKEFWDATHNVYAFTVGENDEVVRSSDDGEPAGTAGRPVLEVIRREKIKYCAVVVTRYFGGTLLGAGGLVRAYSSAARDGLHAAGIVRVRLLQKVRFVIDYVALGIVQNYLAEAGYEMDDVEYADRVAMTVMVPSSELDLFEARMMDLLAGDFNPEVGEEVVGFADVKEGEGLGGEDGTGEE
jgi:uncharacterized YigZ family protein